MPYEHPMNDTNLRNLHKAMEYNESDQPAIRTTVSGITLSGEVTVDKVRVEVDAAHNTISSSNPLPISGNADPNADDNQIYVDIGSNGIVGLDTGSNTIGKVDLNAGTNTIGNVKIVDSLGNLNSNSYPLYVSVTNSELEIKNDSNNPIPISKNTSANSQSNPIYVSATGTTIVNFDSAKTDAFGRLRVSNPLTLFDSNFRYGDNIEAWGTAVTGNGAATYMSAAKVVALTVTTSNDSVIRETKRCYTYQPGKSLLIMNTFCMSEPVTGLRQRVGYFGARNGVYLETNDEDISFVIRKDITGVVTDDERAEKASWNGDRLNSAVPTTTCPSGIELDLSKPQIFWMDVEWLGVGSVRCGFVINGQFILCHTFQHANVGNITGPYMATASLPVRYEITANGNVTATLNQICSTVISEGGYEPSSRIHTASMGVDTKTLTTSGTYYPLISIKLNSSYPDAIVRLHQLQGMLATASSTPRNINFKILRNATLTGASWIQHSSLHVDYDLSATTFAGGEEIYQGYFNATKPIDFGNVTNPSYQLGRSIAQVSDVFTLVVTGDSNNLGVAMEMGWYDFS